MQPRPLRPFHRPDFDSFSACPAVQWPVSLRRRSLLDSIPFCCSLSTISYISVRTSELVGPRFRPNPPGPSQSSRYSFCVFSRHLCIYRLGSCVTLLVRYKVVVTPTSVLPVNICVQGQRLANPTFLRPCELLVCPQLPKRRNRSGVRPSH